eukprot:762967-Hanusia_phi.AAC.1
MPSGPAACGCECIAACSNESCSCSTSGLSSGPAQCGCTCVRPSCSSCTCDESGNPSGNALCQCGCMANATTGAASYFSNGTTQSYGSFSKNTLTLTVATSLSVNTLYSFSFQFTNPPTPQSAPALYISVNGSVTFDSQRIYNQNLTIFGVSNGGNVLEIVQPSFIQALITQSTPVAGVLNSLTLTLQMNCDLPAGSEITVSGLYGASTDNSSLLISSTPSDFQQSSIWSRANGTLVIKSAGAYSLTIYTITFNLTNGVIDQSSPPVYISCFFLLETCFSNSLTFDMTKLHSPILGVANGTDPLQILSPVFSLGYIVQISPLPSSTNALYVTLEANMNLEKGSIITLSNLIYASFPNTIFEVYNSTGQPDVHFSANSNIGYGLAQPGEYNTILFTVDNPILALEKVQFWFDIRNPGTSYIQRSSNESVCVDAGICQCSSLCGCNQYQSFEGLIQIKDVFLESNLICAWRINLPLPGTLNVYIDITFSSLQYSITLSKPFLIINQCYDTSCTQTEAVKTVWQLSERVLSAISSPSGFIEIKMPGNFSETSSLSYNMSIAWNGSLHRPDILVEAQGTLDSFPPGAPSFPAVRLNTSNQDAKGVRNGSQALYMIVPEFIVRNVGQSNPLAGATNNITLTLSANCDVPFGSNLTISGLKNTSTSDSSAFPIVADQSFNSIASWNASGGAVVMSLNNSGLSSYSNYIISFSLQNIDSAQASQKIYVYGQIASGMYGSYFAVGIPSSPYIDLGLMNSSTDSIQGVYEGRSPMLVIIPRFLISLLSQSNPLTSAENTLTATLKANCDVTTSSTITLNGLNGTQTPDSINISLSFDDSIANITGSWMQSPGTLEIKIHSLLTSDLYLSFSFTLQNSVKPQISPSISISATIFFGTHNSLIQWSDIDKDNGTILEIVGGRLPLFMIPPGLNLDTTVTCSRYFPGLVADYGRGYSEPCISIFSWPSRVFNGEQVLLDFSQTTSTWFSSLISQTWPFINQSNNLSLSIVPNCTISNGSWLEFSGFLQTQSVTNHSFALGGLHAYLFSNGILPSSAIWFQSNGTLKMQCVQDLFANQSYEIHFTVINPSAGQTSPTISVSGQIAAGAFFSEFPFQNLSAKTSLSSVFSYWFGYSQSYPIERPLEIVEITSSANITQFTPLTSADNVLSISFIFSLWVFSSQDSLGSWIGSTAHKLVVRFPSQNVNSLNAYTAISVVGLTGTLTRSSTSASPPIVMNAKLNYGTFVSSSTSVPVLSTNTTLQGVPYASAALFITQPYISFSSMEQSDPLAGAFNQISINLSFSCNLAPGSSLTISGITGTTTQTLGSGFEIGGPNSSLFVDSQNEKSRAAWNQITGSLILLLDPYGKTVYSETVLGISFYVTNSLSPQMPPPINVRVFVRSGSVSGFSFIHFAEIPTTQLNVVNASKIGITSGSLTMYIVAAKTVLSDIVQSSPLADADNTLSVSLQTNCDLKTASTITIAGLVNSQSGDSSCLP